MTSAAMSRKSEEVERAERVGDGPSWTPDDLGRAMIRGIADGELQRVDPPVDHLFADGIYQRRIYCEAGTVVVTMRHLTEHITEVNCGTCEVVDGDGNRRVVTGGERFVTPSGTQRMVRCLTDAIWTTTHKNPDNLRDIESIEAYVFDDTLDDDKVAMLGDRPKMRITQ